MKVSSAVSLDVSGINLSSLGGSCESHEDFLRLLAQAAAESLGSGDTADGVDLHSVDRLDLSRCSLGPKGLEKLLGFLPSCLPSLKSLSLVRNAITSTGGRTIGRFLREGNTQLEELNLGLNDINAGGGDPPAAEIISAALTCKSTSLGTLLLEKCALGPRGASLLAAGLLENGTVHTLELSGNMIGPLGATTLFDALKQNATLTNLGLRMNRIGGCPSARDVQSLAAALARGCLTKLDLSYNDLRCRGCVILSGALNGPNCALQELSLEKNDISRDGVVAICNSNRTVQGLVLKGNNVGRGRGACDAIGSMLARNKSLQFFDLSSSGVDNEGGAAIGDGLSQNSTLKCLLLGGNSLGRGTNTGFFRCGLSANTCVTEIDVNSNGVGEVGSWDDAVTRVLSSSFLSRIRFSNNSLSSTKMIDAIVSNEKIRNADLSDNKFESIAVDTQLALAKRLGVDLEMDLSLNSLSSPPLGKVATHRNLLNWVTLLENEKTTVKRIRLMVGRQDALSFIFYVLG